MEKAIGAVFVTLAVLILFSFLWSWPVMMLWNGCLVDAVSGLKEITWLQAWGINFLCGILFTKTTSK